MKKLLIVSFCFITLSLSAQFQSQPIFTQGDKISVNLSIESGQYYIHEIRKGHTLYSLAKVFEVPMEILLSFNNLDKNAQMKLGQKIKIPLKKEIFNTSPYHPLDTKAAYIPVVYKVKKKETLYKISKVHFQQSVKDVIKRNNLKSNIISRGQELIVGWFMLTRDRMPKVYVHEKDEFEEDLDLNPDTDSIADLENNDTTLDSITKDDIPVGFNTALLGTQQYSPTMVESTKNVVAYWDKSIPSSGPIFALHSTAIIGTMIAIYNPLVKRSVRAKVIGRIPTESYTKNVELVISPRAAKQLGGLDARFNVEVKLLKNKG